jgi:hypothetical protein
MAFYLSPFRAARWTINYLNFKYPSTLQFYSHYELPQERSATVAPLHDAPGRLTLAPQVGELPHSQLTEFRNNHFKVCGTERVKGTKSTFLTHTELVKSSATTQNANSDEEFYQIGIPSRVLIE